MHTCSGGWVLTMEALTCTGALDWTVTAVSAAWMKDHLIWMSSFFSFMWSSS